MSHQVAGDTYAMGRTEEEEQRLQTQADFLAGPTRRLLINAGITPGMKVLDLGSGAGDVALLAAELVGPTGAVVGVDSNGVILETARRRATEAGYPNVTFVEGDLRTIELDDDFDAVVSRFIFCHLADPTAVLRDVLKYLRPGGIVAACEGDYMTLFGENSYPPCPLFQRGCFWVAKALEYRGVDMQAASRLHQVFCDAGLEAPSMHADTALGGSEEFLRRIAEYAADTARSLLPLILRAGIATEEEVGIETLAQRVLDETLTANAVVRSYLLGSAWARKPA